MSDKPEQPDRPMPPGVAAALDPDVIAELNRACELALKKQLNKNEEDPRLKALADKWKNMDAFSKRELGQKDTPKSPDVRGQMQSTATQITPGQTAEVIGPATIYGGKVELEKKDG